MPISRRRFLTAVGASAAGAAVLPALDDRHDLFAETVRVPRPVVEGLIRLDKNENPAGPFPSARRAINDAMSEAGRYPYEAESKLTEAIARMHSVQPTSVSLGCGSGEILRSCTEKFTSPKHGLVAASPTFESCSSYATKLGHPVAAVPVTKSMQLDLDAMASAAKGAGLVYLCNPNNPTSTVHGAAAVRGFLSRVRRESPDTYILVDEAYHEYVDEPTYSTMIPESQHDKHVIVSRTFSKVFGMAGLRVGYAVGMTETIALLDGAQLDSDVNQLAAAAALTALDDHAAVRAEQQRNRDVRAFVTKWFTSRGYNMAKSDANFVFVDIRRDVAPVIAACYSKDVAVGRPFPPLTTHLRLTIGTQAEMEKAMAVIGQVLSERASG